MVAVYPSVILVKLLNFVFITKPAKREREKEREHEEKAKALKKTSKGKVSEETYNKKPGGKLYYRVERRVERGWKQG